MVFRTVSPGLGAHDGPDTLTSAYRQQVVDHYLPLNIIVSLFKQQVYSHYKQCTQYIELMNCVPVVRDKVCIDEDI